MNSKFYQAKKTIHGVEYTAQFNGISAALRAIDSTYIEGTKNTSVERFSQYILDNVIVEPKGLTTDDFTSTERLGEVTSWASEVMNGNFRNEADQKPAGAKGKE